VKENEGSSHIFDPRQWQKLESAERRERMNPAWLVDAMRLGKDEVALDIGCGTGFFAEAAAGRVAKLIGVDRSEDMLNVFRAKDGFSEFGNIDLRIGDAADLPVEDGSCDVVFHVCILHEIKDVARFHAEIMRALKLGGRVYCVDWEARDTEGGPPVDHRVSKETAMQWLIRDGFKDARELDVYRDQYVIEARK